MSEKLRQRIAKFPRAIEPVYSTQSPNEPITLYRGELRVTVAPGEIATGPGRIELRWLPHPRIGFHLSESKPLPAAVELPPVTVEIIDLGIACQGFLTGMSHGAEVTYKGVIESPPIVGEKRECDRVLFHVPNFYPSIGEPIRNDNLRLWRGRLTLESSSLRVILDAGPKSGDLAKSLKAERGFGLTQWCEVILTTFSIELIC